MEDSGIGESSNVESAVKEIHAVFRGEHVAVVKGTRAEADEAAREFANTYQDEVVTVATFREIDGQSNEVEGSRVTVTKNI